MERVTRAHVENVAKNVSELLPDGVRVYVQGRNGGFGLDLLHNADASDSFEDLSRWNVVRTLRFGTKREVLDYLQGMREGLFLQRNGSPQRAHV